MTKGEKSMALHLNIQDLSADEILKQLRYESSQEIDVICKQSQAQILRVEKNNNQATIEYGRRVELFRGLGLLCEHIEEEYYILEQKRSFSTNGVMLDCSRNGVPKISTVKEFIRIMAVMGLDTLMLYTEDTYEVPEYPYFGYMRGRYSVEELQEIDNYADRFGIELIPCIQTLAHLQGMLRWPCFEDMHDCNDILLCDEEKTYELIEAMIRTCRSAFKSRRIHIGMDEAFMMGFGKYRFSHNPLNREEMFCKHIERVNTICKRYDFEPMIWSDMFFRIAFNGEYECANNNEIAPEVIEMLNKNVELVYWDYGKTEKEGYIKSIEQHQKFPNKLMFAGGAWRWIGFAPNLRFSFKASYEALTACRQKSVQDILLTAWGDNGNEASFFNILPIMQLYAEMNYQNDITKEYLEKRFSVCTGEIFNDMLLLDLPNCPETKKHGPAVNPSKYILYQDVLGGLMEKHIDMYYPEYYANVAKQLHMAAKRSNKYPYMYNMLAELSSVLEIKSIVGIQAQNYYKANDKEGLRNIAHKVLPELLDRLYSFHLALEKQWSEENKIFGYEVLDLRIGGLESRVKTAITRLEQYIEGQLTQLEELEVEKLYFDCRDNEDDIKSMSYNLWMPVTSANLI